MAGRTRVVVATPDVLGPKMAGPAIRAYQFATALAAEHDVVLLSTAPSTLPPGDPFRVVSMRTGEDPVAALGPVDVWVVQGKVLQRFPAIEASGAPVVVDLYDPFHLESIEQSRERPKKDRQAIVHNETVVLNASMRRGDFFLAASEKQRDFWLGALTTIGRVNPLTYEDDSSLRSLVDLVPFGISEAPPARTGPALRGVVPGIGPDDTVLLWGGGIYNWFDPETLIRAVDALKDRHPDLRLVFLGGAHPNPAVPAMRAASAARAVSAELGLTGSHVFFNEGWVPYDERGSYFAEADIGVSTHHEHVETAFSFRTRVLDYLWAGLPVVATGGDVFGDLIAQRGFGRVVPPEDVPALTAALDELLSDPAARRAAAEASAAVAQDFQWSAVLAPLLAFCRAPRRAPDLLDPVARTYLPLPFEHVRGPSPAKGLTGQAMLAREYLSEGGLSLVVKRATGRLGKLARGRAH